jgi:hypothetical protein
MHLQELAALHAPPPCRTELSPPVPKGDDCVSSACGSHTLWWVMHTALTDDGFTTMPCLCCGGSSTAHPALSRLLHLPPGRRTSAAAIHGQALDGEPTSLDAAEGSAGTSSPDTVTLGRLVAGAEWRQPLAANWSGTAGRAGGGG